MHAIDLEMTNYLFAHDITGLVAIPIYKQPIIFNCQHFDVTNRRSHNNYKIELFNHEHLDTTCYVQTIHQSVVIVRHNTQDSGIIIEITEENVLNCKKSMIAKSPLASEYSYQFKRKLHAKPKNRQPSCRL